MSITPWGDLVGISFSLQCYSLVEGVIQRGLVSKVCIPYIYLLPNILILDRTIIQANPDLPDNYYGTDWRPRVPVEMLMENTEEHGGTGNYECNEKLRKKIGKSFRSAHILLILAYRIGHMKRIQNKPSFEKIKNYREKIRNELRQI